MKLTIIVILLESGHLSFLDVVHYFVGLHTYTLHCHRTDVLGLDLYKVMATRGLGKKRSVFVTGVTSSLPGTFSVCDFTDLFLSHNTRQVKTRSLLAAIVEFKMIPSWLLWKLLLMTMTLPAVRAFMAAG